MSILKNTVVDDDYDHGTVKLASDFVSAVEDRAIKIQHAPYPTHVKKLEYEIKVNVHSAAGSSFSGHWMAWVIYVHKDEQIYNDINANPPLLFEPESAVLDFGHTYLNYDHTLGIGGIKQISWNGTINCENLELAPLDKIECRYRSSLVGISNTVLIQVGSRVQHNN